MELHPVNIQRRSDVAATSWRCSDVRTALCVCWATLPTIVTKVNTNSNIDNQNAIFTENNNKVAISKIALILKTSRGGGVTSYIWHGTGVRAEWPPFSALPGIWFQQKVYDWPYFSWFLCERPHFSDILVYAYIFFAQRFVEAACSLGIQWADCYICPTTSNKWV